MDKPLYPSRPTRTRGGRTERKIRREAIFATVCVPAAKNTSQSLSWNNETLFLSSQSEQKLQPGAVSDRAPAWQRGEFKRPSGRSVTPPSQFWQSPRGPGFV